MKEKIMKIKPLFDRIVISEIKEQQTSSGIFLGSHDQEGVKIGTVLFVPNECENPDGKNFKLHIQPGDKVLFNKYSGVETIVDKKTLIFIRQTDILAVIE